MAGPRVFSRCIRDEGFAPPRGKIPCFTSFFGGDSVAELVTNDRAFWALLGVLNEGEDRRVLVCEKSCLTGGFSGQIGKRQFCLGGGGVGILDSEKQLFVARVDEGGLLILGILDEGTQVNRVSLRGLLHFRSDAESDDVQVGVLGEAEVVGEGVWGDLPRALFATQERITHFWFALAIPTFECA